MLIKLRQSAKVRRSNIQGATGDTDQLVEKLPEIKLLVLVALYH